ncbi:hypothetical protein WJM93_13965 [Lactiplantibacillus plantarum]|uniref:hypothetical protein n=1 Tax=Lactiplantibacillus plantarum TaxID=1590 RepID=UPI0030999087
MRKVLFLLSLSLVSLELAGCGRTNHINKVKILKTSEAMEIENEYDWKIEGTTNAPDNSKIIIYSDNPSFNEAESIDNDWVKVKNGKFTAYLDSRDIMNKKKHYANDKKAIHIVAINNFSHDFESKIPKKIADKLVKNSSEYMVSLTKSQAESLNNYNGKGVKSENDKKISEEESRTTRSKQGSNPNAKNDYKEIASVFDLDNINNLTEEQTFGNVVTIHGIIDDIGADGMHNYHVVFHEENTKNAKFIMTVGSKKSGKLKLDDHLVINGTLLGPTHVNDVAINTGISPELYGEKVMNVQVDEIKQDKSGDF